MNRLHAPLSSRATRIRIACAVGFMLSLPPASAQPRRVDVPRSEQTVGSWLIACATDPMTDMRVCRMRHVLWLAVPSDSHAGLALEAQLRGDQLVPVLTVRALSLGTALSGLLALTATAQRRFDGAPVVELPCALEGAAVVGAPGKADAALLVGQLVGARSVLVGFRSIGNLPLPVPDGPLALDLDRTPEALARFRGAGPEVVPAQSSLNRDLRNRAEQVLRWLGLPGIETEQAPAR